MRMEREAIFSYLPRMEKDLVGVVAAMEEGVGKNISGGASIPFRGA